MNIIVTLIMLSMLMVGCHRRDGSDQGDIGIPQYTLLAGNFQGTINGSPSSMFMYKSGDRIYGIITIGAASGRVNGTNDPNVMRLSAETTNLGFAELLFHRNGNVWNIVHGGSGSLTHID